MKKQSNFRLIHFIFGFLLIGCIIVFLAIATAGDPATSLLIGVVGVIVIFIILGILRWYRS